MILTVEEVRQLITTDETDQGLRLRLEALEKTIQGYTNNDFHKFEENGVIVYPADIKLGAIGLLKWDLTLRGKVGIASEAISRHGVTYQNMDGENAVMGYPKSLLGFLKPYMRARFGRGIGG